MYIDQALLNRITQPTAKLKYTANVLVKVLRELKESGVNDLKVLRKTADEVLNEAGVQSHNRVEVIAYAREEAAKKKGNEAVLPVLNKLRY